MRRRISWKLFPALGLMLLVAAASGVFLSTASAAARCTAETLKGDYGFITHASRYSSPGGREVADRAVVGQLHSDGKGTLTGKKLVTSDNGTPGEIPLVPGTYTVGPNCAGDMTFPNGASWHFVIVNRGEAFRFMISVPGITGTGSGTRMQDQNCTDTTLKGEYGYEIQGSLHQVGTNIETPFPTAGDVAASGWVSFDGKGMLNGDDMASLDGAPIHRTYSGMYRVNQDCSGEATVTFVTTAGSQTEHIHLVILERGEDFLAIDRDAGVVVAAMFTEVQHG